MIQLTEEAINKIQIAIGQVIRHLAKESGQPHPIYLQLEQVEAEADIIGQLTKVPITGYWVGDMIRVDIRL